jgi:hypothetical protein
MFPYGKSVASGSPYKSYCLHGSSLQIVIQSEQTAEHVQKEIFLLFCDCLYDNKEPHEHLVQFDGKFVA